MAAAGARFLGLDFAPPDLDPARVLATSFDPALVVLSVAIAAFAAFAAFALEEQARASRARAERVAWLAGSALALGGGTWAMHFLGMLAWDIALPVHYDPFLTAVSAVPIAVAAGLALWVTGHSGAPRPANLALGGVVLGAGIGLMHYTGMAAVRMEAAIYYDPAVFAASIALAAALSVGALWLKGAVVDPADPARAGVTAAGAAVLMGVAISIMHYTGMAAAICVARPGPVSGGAELRHLAASVGVAASMLLTVAMAASQIRQRLRLIPELERGHEELEARVERRTSELSREIAERRRIESDLVVAMFDAERANRMKSAFLSNMSHELRTPLNGIIGYLELLSGDAYDRFGRDKVRAIVADLHGASTHLLSLIDQVLDMSRIEAGMEEVRGEPVAVGAAVAGTIDMVAGLAAGKSIDLAASPADASLVARCDPKHFRQVLINLLSNAIKYTPGGGRVRVDASRGPDGRVALAVRDTGVGIAPDDLDRVFFEFARSENAMVRAAGGSGLGLPLTKRLVEMNGGTIALESEPGTGTTVTVVYPAWDADRAGA